jgi:hypothetical protein
VANDAPDALAFQRSITLVLLVVVELVIGEDLKGKASAEDEDGQVVSPFDRCREGGPSTSTRISRFTSTVTGGAKRTWRTGCGMAG